jgi:hypothetical protein
MANGRKINSAWAFSSENDLDRTLQSNRQTLGLSSVNGLGVTNDVRRVFVKVTAIVAATDNKVAKAKEVVPDVSTGDFETPDGVQWVFDSDLLANDQTTTSIYSMFEMAVDDIFEVMLFPDNSLTYQWKAINTSAGTSTFLLIITANVTNDNTYTCNIINNRTDKTVITTAVTMKALDHTTGIIPTGVTLTCTYDSDNEFYEPTNYSVFY